MKILIKLSFFKSSDYWQRYLPRMLKLFLAIVGALWLTIQIVNYFFNKIIPDKPYVFWSIIGLSLFLAFIFNLQKLTFYYFINNKDIKIKMVIGDIFKQKGDIVLATNTTFDTTFKNDFINANGIQGKLTSKYYDNIEYLDSDLERALVSYNPKEKLDRKNSKKNRYEIGTTVKLVHKKFKSYWVALADVSEQGKPNSTFADLQTALESLWNFMHTNGHMDRLVVPILGSGKSAINESRERLLKEIIYSFVTFSNEKKITEELVICIYPKDFIEKNIDLHELDKFLEYNCRYRYENTKQDISSIGI